MTDTAASDVSRSPFEGVPPRALVRDVLAVVGLLVALPMPWDLTHRGSDRLEVVLVSVLALLTVVVPYLRRAGLGAPSWDALTSPRARLIGCAPYVVVAVAYLVLDGVRPAGADGAVGAGVVLGLTGAVLAVAPTWRLTLPVVAGVVALGALATPVVSLIQGAPWPDTVVGVLNAAVVLGLLWLTAVDFWRGHLVGGLLLLALGGGVALELVLFAGGEESPWFETIHGQRLGLLLLPVVAACGARPVLEAAGAVAAEPEDERAARWVSVAVRSLDLVMLVAGFVALVGLVRLVGDGVAVSFVLRLVTGALMVAVAFAARRALERDPRTGHTTAVGAAFVLVVLGLVIVVARSGLGTRSNVEELLVTFGLPALALVALLVPPSVRALVASEPEPEPEPVAATAPATGQVPAASWTVAAPQQPGAPTAAAVAPSGATPVATAQALMDATQQIAPVRDTPTGVTPSGATPATSPRAASAQAPMDATQQIAPVRDTPTGATPAVDAGPAAGAAPAGASRATEPVATGPAGGDPTQSLPPVVDVPGSPWTAAQALDPAIPLADLARIVAEAPHLRPCVAANPSTYPALLDWLGALGDPDVDAALRSRR